MESTRNLTSSEAAGSESGTVFDDKSIVPDIGTAAITKIVLGHADYVRSITVDQPAPVIVFLLTV